MILQIRTAIAIGTGIAIGTVIGMGVSEDTKIEIVNKFKKRLIYALTGEEWKPKKYNPAKDPYRTSYSTYGGRYKTKTPEKKENNIYDDNCRFIESLLTLNDEIQENDIKNGLEALLNEYGYFSIEDIALARGKPIIDHFWGKYGWTNSMITDEIVVISSIDKKEYVIVLPDPKYLKDKMKI